METYWDYTAAIASLAQAVAVYGRIGDRAGQAGRRAKQGTVNAWTGNHLGGPRRPPAGTGLWLR